MNRKSASDLLREKYMASQLKKTTLEKKHPGLSDAAGIDYLRDDIQNKLYMPLLGNNIYSGMGVEPPRTLLIRGISGVGKSFIINCFCQTFQIPLITGFIGSDRDIRELFAKSKAAERSIILISSIESILEEKSLIYQLKQSIKSVDWKCMVVLSHKSEIEEIPYENEIFVKIPNVTARKEILDSLLMNIRKEGIDTMEIAQHTPGCVPRNLVRLVSMAVTSAVGRSEEARRVFSQQLCENTMNNEIEQRISLIMTDFVKSIREWKHMEQNVTFDDIGALDQVKEELTMSILLPSKFPEKFNKFGIYKPSGVLLYGPPGCGKTLIAKAVSNMSHCNFLSVKGPELITKYVGDSEMHLRNLFQRARNLSPCVIFFDEIDSLCGRRGKNEFGNRIVNQILTLLDGIEDRGEVYIIAATNRIKSLDPALMRPGRLDKIVEVPLPGPVEALEIFRKCVMGIPIEPFDPAGLDLSGLSGADIAGVVKEASILCLKDNFDVTNLRISEGYFKLSIEKHRSMRRTR
ncbi:ribosome biogenesis ATPase [Pancytospora epiphaga]|nr:ribosome biogenesis ATPase [Pancytospora epiphaga]